jgi:lipase ATG15
LASSVSVPFGAATKLGDYSFLSTLNYFSPEEVAPILEQWFGPDEIVDEYEVVDQYRQEANTAWHPVSYKLFSFPNTPGHAVLNIRGSESMCNWVTNVNLWSGAGLTQVIRAIMPLGWIWTPIFDNLVRVVNNLESDQLKEKAYYRKTTAFVEALQAGYGNDQFSTVRITGVSMGGGLSIITGAQTGSATVSFSGPNAMMSRHNFQPPLTPEQLNTFVINVIPDRDIIARVDDPGRLYQKIECSAPGNSLLGCHSMWRTLCEIQYQCGVQAVMAILTQCKMVLSPFSKLVRETPRKIYSYI